MKEIVTAKKRRELLKEFVKNVVIIPRKPRIEFYAPEDPDTEAKLPDQVRKSKDIANRLIAAFRKNLQEAEVPELEKVMRVERLAAAQEGGVDMLPPDVRKEVDVVILDQETMQKAAQQAADISRKTRLEVFGDEGIIEG